MRTSNGCPGRLDLFPKGGIANFYCHVQSLLSVERLEQLAGMTSTVAPPPDAPPRSVARAFRNYDPRFVAWLRRALLVAAVDPRFRQETQPIYDQFVAPLARKWLGARRLMVARRRWLDAEVRWTRSAIEAGTLPEGYYVTRYDHFAAPAPSDDGTFRALDPTARDENVGASAVAFWIRRELDGSAAPFSEALEELVATYDGDWLRGGAGVVVVPPPDRDAARAAPESGAAAGQAASARPPPAEPAEPSRIVPSGAPPTPDDAVIAEGRDLRITAGQFLARIGEQPPFLRARQVTLAARREFLDGMIRHGLLAAEARWQGIETGFDGTPLLARARREAEAIRRRGGPADEEQLLDKLRVQTLVQRLMTTEGRPPPNEEELRAWYDQHRGELAREGRGPPALEQVREQVAQRILRAQAARELEQHLTDLRERAGVRVDEQALAAIQVK